MLKHNNTLFCSQESLGSTYFPKEYLITRKNNSQEYLFPEKL